MDLTISMKKELITFILDKQKELLEEDIPDMDYIMYIDDIKDLLWDSIGEQDLLENEQSEEAQKMLNKILGDEDVN